MAETEIVELRPTPSQMSSKSDEIFRTSGPVLAPRLAIVILLLWSSTAPGQELPDRQVVRDRQGQVVERWELQGRSSSNPYYVRRDRQGSRLGTAEPRQYGLRLYDRQGRSVGAVERR